MMESTVQDPGFEAPSVEELRPLFPACEIDGFLAQGGMGAVYCGRQKSLDRPVAIKILPREFGADDQFRAKFRGEAKAMARLNHPNLIGVHDFGEVDGYLFIIMELVEGDSLHHSAGGRAIEQREAARLIAGICRGLAHAHRNGILHRVIKPDNILLAPGPQPKIADFGLARPMGEGEKTGEMIYGTPGYSAPEVVKNPAAVDQRADIFSVGVMLYELLTGHKPGDPWRTASALVGCDPKFDLIIRRAAHPSPEMRYADAGEMASDLEKLAAKPSRAIPAIGPAAAVPRGPAARPPTMPGARSVVPARQSKTGMIAAIVAALIGLVATAAWFASNARNDGTSAAGGAATETVAELLEVTPRPAEPVPAEPVVSVPEKPPEPVEPSTPISKPPETTLECLARLRPRLLNGDYTELPKGAARRGGSHILLVETKLNWDAASRFAERHGAQMAVLESANDLAWAVSECRIEEPVWLGLSDSGMEGRWVWVNGKGVEEALWAPGQPDNTVSEDDDEDFAVLLPRGILDDEPGSRERMFLLEWAKDGANPGSLANQLDRAGAALQARQSIVFPAGARNIGGSRFLVVPVSVSWEQAAATAKAAGGHLAVPSSQAEAAWISKAVPRVLERGESCWVGGRLTTGISPAWTFVTGERFEFVNWLPGRPDGDGAAHLYLQLTRLDDGPDRLGYDDSRGSASTVSCFLVEWSAPSRRNMPGRDPGQSPANAREWLLALQQKIHEEHKDSGAAFRRKWDRNLENYVKEVKATADSMGRGRRRGGLRGVADRFTGDIERSGRIPESVPEYARWSVGEIHDKALDKQKKIQAEHEAEVGAALESYLEEIRAMRGRLSGSGRLDDASYLEREAEATSADPDRFDQILDGESPPVPDA